MSRHTPHTSIGNLADLFETIAETIPDAPCLGTAGEKTKSWREVEERSTALAQGLLESGLRTGEWVGLYMTNGHEYMESMIACFKARLVPVNINYRYVADELVSLFDDADLSGLIFEETYKEQAIHAALHLKNLHFLLQIGRKAAFPTENYFSVEDSLPTYENLISDHYGASLDVERSPDDLYVLYTGGTTGRPKGVLWRQEDIFYGALAGALERPAPRTLKQAAEMSRTSSTIGFPAPPYMHGTAHWFGFWCLFDGGMVTCTRGEGFDPVLFWEICEREHVTHAAIVGDSFARPLIEAWDTANGYDVSLTFLLSGGALLSPTTKKALRDRLPDVNIADGLGTSESGGIGRAGQENRFRAGRSVRVLGDDGAFLPPGSRESGRIAKTGRIPLGYHKDPERTAKTFPTIEGRRWVVAGDRAHLHADGMIELLGRGSSSINSGGEKIYPEEVEAAVLAHPDIADVLVVGIPSEQWGEAVTAVVAPKLGTIEYGSISIDDIRECCRERLARYKWPKFLVVVPNIQRSPAGKPDYEWARIQAITTLKTERKQPKK